jgi:hypothetical protein
MRKITPEAESQKSPSFLAFAAEMVSIIKKGLMVSIIKKGLWM